MTEAYSQTAGQAPHPGESWDGPIDWDGDAPVETYIVKADKENWDDEVDTFLSSGESLPTEGETING